MPESLPPSDNVEHKTPPLQLVNLYDVGLVESNLPPDNAPAEFRMRQLLFGGLFIGNILPFCT